MQILNMKGIGGMVRVTSKIRIYSFYCVAKNWIDYVNDCKSYER